MAEIDDYIEVLFYLNLPGMNLPQRFVRREEVVPLIKAGLDGVLAEFDDKIRSSTHVLAEVFFDRLLEQSAFSISSDKFAGTYYHYAAPQASQVREQFLKKSHIHQQSQAIGPRFFPDVFSGYVGLSPVEDSPQVPGVVVPASDRIVTLAHNQTKEIEGPLEELVLALEADNGIPDRPGLKERLLGQVRAGRELIRVGTFKSYVLYVTLLSALNSLVEKYKGHAIGAVAATLVELLIKHVFGAEG